MSTLPGGITLAEVRHANAAGADCAQRQFGERHPRAADLPGRGRFKIAIVRIANGALDRQLVDEGQVAQEWYDQLGISFRHMVRGTEFGLVRRPGAEMRQLLFGRRGAIVVDVMDRFPTMFDAERGLNVAGR